MWALLESIGEFIAIIAIIYGITSSIQEKIVEYFPFLEEYKYIVSFLTAILFLIIYFRYSIKKNSINVKYRLMNKPEALDLKMDELDDTINVIFKKENEESLWLKFLSYLTFDIFIKVDFPVGIRLEMERNFTEFKILEDNPQNLLIITLLSTSGRRRMPLYVQSMEYTNFDGGSPIYINVYIAPKRNLLHKLLQIGLGSEKIDILPSRG